MLGNDAATSERQAHKNHAPDHHIIIQLPLSQQIGSKTPPQQLHLHCEMHHSMQTSAMRAQDAQFCLIIGAARKGNRDKTVALLPPPMATESTQLGTGAAEATAAQGHRQKNPDFIPVGDRTCPRLVLIAMSGKHRLQLKPRCCHSYD
jgi:hypothetical protein